MSRTLTSSEMRVLAHVPNYVVRGGERVTAQVVVLGLCLTPTYEIVLGPLLPLKIKIQKINASSRIT